jgi:hypothetical protein
MGVINYPMLATGALGFTVAMAWNDAASRIIRSVFPQREGAAHAAVAYAMMVTLVVILIAVCINRAHIMIRGEGVVPEASPARPLSGIVQLWAPGAANYVPTQ